MNLLTPSFLGNKQITFFNQCKERSDGKLNLLKQAILEVAKENDLMVGALANFVAHEAKVNSEFKYKELLAMAENLQLEGR